MLYTGRVSPDWDAAPQICLIFIPTWAAREVYRVYAAAGPAASSIGSEVSCVPGTAAMHIISNIIQYNIASYSIT